MGTGSLLHIDYELVVPFNPRVRGEKPKTCLQLDFFTKTLDKIQHYHRLGETTSLVFVIFGNLCLENSNPGVINSQRLHSHQGSYWHPVILIVDQNISEDATGCTGSPLHPKYYPVCSCCGVCHLSIPLLGQIDDGKHICKYGAA